MYESVAGEKSMTDIDRDILRGLADNNMNTSQTAKAIYIGHSTIYRHIDAIRKETGLDPLKFWDLTELLKGGAE